MVPFGFVTIVYGTQLGDNAEQMPPWLIGATGLGYFMYRLFDEMDGKQARKTGNASPLGLLFDHGVDSWIIGFMVWLCCKSMVGNGGNLNSLYIFECTCLFYFGTLEEFYVGGLHLRPGNGITDGSLPVISIFLFLSVTGNEIMQVPLIAGNEHTRGSTLIVYLCVLFTLKHL
jgi:ethanolaminephosphotransferase